MSSVTHTPQSNYQLILHALASYADQTGIDLSTNPFADKLQDSELPDAILELLHDREKAFKEYREGNRKLIHWLTPAVQVLHAFGEILGESLSLVPFPPAKAIFVGVDILLAAASSVSSSCDALLDLFECIGNFLQRLAVYTRIPPTHEMTDIVVKIMVELLSVLALATKQIKQGRFKKFAKKLLGEGEVESVLQRLDRLTQDEARMTAAQTLDVVHGLVSNMRVVIDDGKTSMDSVRETLVTMHQMANEVNKMKRDQMQTQVQHWLSPPDPSMNHCFVSKARQTGSGAWFFNGNVLTQWRETGSLLWIHGKPGSGKSTLLSAIIQDIEPMCEAGLAVIAYYYFDFRDEKKQTRNGLLSSLLSQLSADSDSFCDILSRLRSSHAGGTRKPTDKALTKCLRDMLSLPGRGPIYLIVDAIDECPNTTSTPSPREEVLELVQELVDWHLPHVHLCLTSRPEIDIRTVFEPLIPLRISLHDEIGQKQDIIDYINASILSDKKMRKWRKEDQQLVIDTLSGKANGMFRWVVCQVERLRHCFPASIQRVLNDLPRGLDETYEHTLLGIHDEQREFAQRLFYCLAVSIRPLRVEELADILAIQFDRAHPPVFNADWRPMDAEEAVLSACSSLITIVNVDDSQVVQFVHFSVKEFLTSDRLSSREGRLSYYHIPSVSAHAVLALASLTALLQLDDTTTKDTIGDLPLALYAARHWVDHARFGDVSPHIQDQMERLFDSSQPHFAAWVWIYDVDHDWVEPMSGKHLKQPQATPLYYASICNLPALVEHLVIAHPSEVSARGGSHVTALHAASVQGFVEVVRLLLGHDADFNSRGDEGCTPLHLASRRGHLSVVESLLEHGADVNSLNQEGISPLCLASIDGRVEVARFLLNRGAKIDHPDPDGVTPIQYASQYGEIDIVRLLLACGSNTESRNYHSCTALDLAARFGHSNIVQVLLEHGANVDPLDNDYQTPLHKSCEAGYLDVVRLLLEHGADMDAEDKNGLTPCVLAQRKGKHDVAHFLLERSASSSKPIVDRPPLHTASKNGNLEVLRSFLESGEDVNIQNLNQETPLMLASGNGKLEVSQFLVENGANPNLQGANGWGALHLASRKGYLNIVQLLLDHGADINATTTDGRTPLDHASSKGFVEVVRLLINRGANLDVREKTGWTPLHRASRSSQLDVVQLLLEHGADVNVQDVEGLTPLDIARDCGNFEVAGFLQSHASNPQSKNDEDWTLVTASRKGRVDIVESLLEGGEDVNAPNEFGETALDLASYFGHFDTVKLLLEQRADVDSMDYNGWRPLHSAAEGGHLNIVNLLLEHGANIDPREKLHFTPLLLASRSGHFGVVQRLLECGANARVRSGGGMSPFQLASSNGHRDVAQLLSTA